MTPSGISQKPVRRHRTGKDTAATQASERERWTWSTVYARVVWSWMSQSLRKICQILMSVLLMVDNKFLNTAQTNATAKKRSTAKHREKGIRQAKSLSKPCSVKPHSSNVQRQKRVAVQDVETVRECKHFILLLMLRMQAIRRNNGFVLYNSASLDGCKIKSASSGLQDSNRARKSIGQSDLTRFNANKYSYKTVPSAVNRQLQEADLLRRRAEPQVNTNLAPRENSESIHCIDEAEVYMLDPKDGLTRYVWCQVSAIGGEVVDSVLAFVDCGAQVSVVSDKVAESIGWTMPNDQLRVDRPVFSLGNHKTSLLGCIHMTVDLQETVTTFNGCFGVIPEEAIPGPFKILIGVDMINRHFLHVNGPGLQ